MKPGSMIAAALFAMAAAWPLFADDAQNKGPAAASRPSAQLADGEVRKVDKEAKKITLRHGPIPSLDMPAMSMVFQVKDPAMLDQVKAGDKIRFQAEKIGGQYTVTHIEPTK